MQTHKYSRPAHTPGTEHTHTHTPEQYDPILMYGLTVLPVRYTQLLFGPVPHTVTIGSEATYTHTLCRRIIRGSGMEMKSKTNTAYGSTDRAEEEDVYDADTAPISSQQTCCA